MSKQILILTGSPRPNGNSFLLAEAFKKGAEEAGHTVHRFDTAHVEIDGCRACNQCYQSFRRQFVRCIQHTSPIPQLKKVFGSSENT